MKAANKPTLQVFKQPFAEGGLCTAIKSTRNGTDFNFMDGFTSAYSTPKANGGRYITRGEMNAIGNLASHNPYFFMCGGLNTFNANFSALIGGYPEGAILQFLDGEKLYFVRSLVDDNTVDFTTVGVDGINWEVVELGTIEAERDKDVLLNITNMGTTRSLEQIVGVWKATKNGILVVSGGADIERPDEDPSISLTSQMWISVAKATITTEGDTTNVTSETGTMIYNLGFSGTTSNVSPFYVKKNEVYCFTLSLIYAKVSNSNISVKVMPV